MTDAPDEDRWQVLSRIVEVRTPWLSMIGERWREGAGQELEYWRVEKPDSLLVVTVHDGRLIAPVRAFRPGAGRMTLDLAGGRLDDPSTLAQTALAIVQREFKLSDNDLFESQEPLNLVGWDVDSATSSQRVFGVAAELRRDVQVPGDRLGASYPATSAGGRELLSEVVCLQCRAVLSEWLGRHP
ncbi:MAG: NUDIX hydrolase [Candidatus Dormibacteria bacterium]